jgi:predicted histidine transporter YuiF (NhaC family)
MPTQPSRLQNDTRTLLRTGGALLGTGLIAAMLIFTSFGGIPRRQGPHTNAGWLALMVAMGCLPTGTMTLLLGIAKAIGDRRR